MSYYSADENSADENSADENSAAKPAWQTLTNCEHMLIKIYISIGHTNEYQAY